RPIGATTTTGSTITTAAPPVRATSPRPVGATTEPRPPAAGATSPWNRAPICGAVLSPTNTSATPPAPSTSPPTPNDSGSPAPSSPTSAKPDHPAPHPARHQPRGALARREAEAGAGQERLASSARRGTASE